jgi:hypothetical protein
LGFSHAFVSQDDRYPSEALTADQICLSLASERQFLSGKCRHHPLRVALAASEIRRPFSHARPRTRILLRGLQ